MSSLTSIPVGLDGWGDLQVARPVVNNFIRAAASNKFPVPSNSFDSCTEALILASLGGEESKPDLANGQILKTSQAPSNRRTTRQAPAAVRRPNRNRPKPNFYVPPNLLFSLTVPYGLMLTFWSAIAPLSIPPFLPLGPVATALGVTMPIKMQTLAAVVAGLHLAYPPLAFSIARARGINVPTSIRWAAAGLIWGIFSLWSLFFYDFYVENAAAYCSLPLSLC